MTVSDDFIPADEEFEAGPTYPTIFGLTITPLISGILLGLLGLIAAIYALLQLVLPALEENQRLNAEVAEKQAKVRDREVIARRINAAKADLQVAKRQQQEVLGLFASEASLNTLLLDINKQINRRSPAQIQQERERKLATCPPAIRQNARQVEEQGKGEFVVTPQLEEFTPDEAKSGIVSDGSYGQALNNKIKRRVIGLNVVANFDDTRQILQRIEQQQNLLVAKNVDFQVQQPDIIYNTTGGGAVPYPTCQLETKIRSTFQLEALMPLSPEEQRKLAPPPGQKPPAS